jgi:hypothetical protein
MDGNRGVSVGIGVETGGAGFGFSVLVILFSEGIGVASTVGEEGVSNKEPVIVALRFGGVGVGAQAPNSRPVARSSEVTNTSRREFVMMIS